MSQVQIQFTDFISNETWKDIPGYSEYQASNLGNIRSFKCNRIRLLTPCERNGYYFVNLQIGKKKHCPNVHKLVMLAFIGVPGENQECDHINRNPKDNRLTNLRYVTKHENLLNKRGSGKSKYRGVSYYNDKQKLKDGTVKTYVRIIATIFSENKTKRIGIFKTEEDAYRAYKAEFKRLHGFEYQD